MPLHSESWTTAMIAQAFRVHQTTIARHLDDYVHKEKLTPANRGTQSYLSPAQTESTKSHIRSRPELMATQKRFQL